MVDINPYDPPQAIDHRKTPQRVRVRRLLGSAVQFGLVSGVLWSTIPMVFLTPWWGASGRLMTLVSGVAAGVLTSLVLAFPLARTAFVVTFFWAILSLTLGGFFFGLTLTWLQFGAWSGGELAFRTGGDGVGVLRSALQYVAAAWWPPLLPLHMPLALVTTMSLRAWILRHSDS